MDTKGCIYRIREYYGCTDKANEGIRLEPSAIAENIRKIERDDPNIRGRNVYGSQTLQYSIKAVGKASQTLWHGRLTL